MKATPAILSILACLNAPVLAQSEPVPGRSDQQVSILEVRRLLPSHQARVDDNRNAAQRNADRRSALARLASLLSKFIDPPLGKDEEITPLGLDRLVVSAGPQKVGWLHRILKRQKNGLERVLLHKVHSWEVSVNDYKKKILPLLAKGRRVDLDDKIPDSVRLSDPDSAQVLEHFFDKDGKQARAAKLRRVTLLPRGSGLQKPAALPFLSELPLLAKAQTAFSQTLRSRWTAQAKVERTNDTSYIKDFEVERIKDAVIANPVVDIIRDGYFLRMTHLDLGPGKIGVDFKLVFAYLKRPIKVFHTKLGSNKVTIQLPELTTWRLAGRLTKTPEESILISLPTRKGRMLLTWIE